MSIMQCLYDSEINVAVSSFWDDGFYVKLGDEVNGYCAEGRCNTWADVEQWLDAMVSIYYPDSAYSRGAERPPSPQLPPGARSGR